LFEAATTAASKTASQAAEAASKVRVPNVHIPAEVPVPRIPEIHIPEIHGPQMTQVIEASSVPPGLTLKPGATSGAATSSSASVNTKVTKIYSDSEASTMAKAQLSKQREDAFEYTKCMLKQLAMTLGQEVGKAAYTEATQAANFTDAPRLESCLDAACMRCSKLSSEVRCRGGSTTDSIAASQLCHQLLRMARDKQQDGLSATLADCPVAELNCPPVAAAVDQAPMTAKPDGSIQVYGFQGMDLLVAHPDQNQNQLPDNPSSPRSSAHIPQHVPVSLLLPVLLFVWVFLFPAVLM